MKVIFATLILFFVLSESWAQDRAAQRDGRLTNETEARNIAENCFNCYTHTTQMGRNDTPEDEVESRVAQILGNVSSTPDPTTRETESDR